MTGETAARPIVVARETASTIASYLVPVLVLLFLPVTRSWYKPTHGRDQLSVSKRSVGKLLLVTLGVIVGIPILLVIVAMLMGG